MLFAFLGVNGMKQLKTKLTIRALLGAVIGMLISAALCAFDGYSKELFLNPPAFFLQIVGSGIFGAVANGGAIVYDIESWSLLKATVLHYILAIGGFVVTSLLLGWFGGTILLIMVGIMTLIYIGIWLFNYLIWKREIRKINEGLGKIRKQEGLGQ